MRLKRYLQKLSSSDYNDGDIRRRKKSLLACVLEFGRILVLGLRSHPGGSWTRWFRRVFDYKDESINSHKWSKTDANTVRSWRNWHRDTNRGPDKCIKSDMKTRAWKMRVFALPDCLERSFRWLIVICPMFKPLFARLSSGSLNVSKN